MTYNLELTSGIGFDDANLPGAEGTMKACRVLVGHFAHSSQAARRLLDYQVGKPRPVGVLQDVSTRWWSTFTMTERLMELKGCFDLMEIQGTLQCNLTRAQWIIVGLVRDILRPFMLAQKVLEGEKYVTLSFVPGIIYGIRCGMKVIEDNVDVPDSVKILSMKMSTDFVKRWGSGDEDTVFSENETEGSYRRLKGLSKLTMIAAALDPRTKLLRGIPDMDKRLLWTHISVVLNEIAVTNLPLPADVHGDGLAPFVANDNNQPDYYDILMEDVNVAVMPDESIPEDISVVDKVKAEIAHYRALPVLPGKKINAAGTTVHSNPLSWWSSQKDKLPLLSKLARRVLCIPATSAPSERVFSAAGLTIANRRASLNAENAAALIFLHDSWPAIEKIEADAAGHVPQKMQKN